MKMTACVGFTLRAGGRTQSRYSGESVMNLFASRVCRNDQVTALVELVEIWQAALQTPGTHDRLARFRDTADCVERSATTDGETPEHAQGPGR